MSELDTADTDREVLAYLTENPGREFYRLHVWFAGLHFRELDRSLQRLRRSGKIEYRQRAWWPRGDEEGGDRG